MGLDIEAVLADGRIREEDFEQSLNKVVGLAYLVRTDFSFPLNLLTYVAMEIYLGEYILMFF
jgi:hypothetical protein